MDSSHQDSLETRNQDCGGLTPTTTLHISNRQIKRPGNDIRGIPTRNLNCTVVFNSQSEKRDHMEITSRIKQLTDELISCSQYRAADGITLLPPEEVEYDKFPPQLIQCVKLLPGNDLCPDCKVRQAQMANNYLTWVNVSFGALICEECAFLHIHFRKKATVLSLHSGTWTLHQVLSVLEGGNRQMLRALEKGRLKSLVGSKEPLSIEMRYASREAAAYRRFLTDQALGLCQTIFAEIGERNKHIVQRQQHESSTACSDQDPFDILSRNNECYSLHEHAARDHPCQGELTISSKSTRQINVEETTNFDQQLNFKRQQVSQQDSGSQTGRGAKGLLQIMKNNTPTAQSQTSTKNQQKGKANAAKRPHHQVDRKQRARLSDDHGSSHLFFQTRIQSFHERKAPMRMEETIVSPNQRNGERTLPESATNARQNHRKNSHFQEISEDILFLPLQSNGGKRHDTAPGITNGIHHEKLHSLNIHQSRRQSICEKYHAASSSQSYHRKYHHQIVSSGTLQNPSQNSHYESGDKQLPLSDDVDKIVVDTPRQYNLEEDGSDGMGNLQPGIHTVFQANQNSDVTSQRESKVIQDNESHDRHSPVIGHGLDQKPTNAISNGKQGTESSCREAGTQKSLLREQLIEKFKRDSDKIQRNLDHGCCVKKRHSRQDSSDDKKSRNAGRTACANECLTVQIQSSNNVDNAVNKGTLLGQPARAIDANKMHRRSSNNADNRGPFGQPTHVIDANKMHRRSSNNADNRGPFGQPTPASIDTNKMHRWSSNCAGNADNKVHVGRATHSTTIGNNKMHRRSSNDADNALGPTAHNIDTNVVQLRNPDNTDNEDAVGLLTLAIDNNTMQQGNSDIDIKKIQRRSLDNTRNKSSLCGFEITQRPISNKINHTADIAKIHRRQSGSTDGRDSLALPTRADDSSNIQRRPSVSLHHKDLPCGNACSNDHKRLHRRGSVASSSFNKMQRRGSMASNKNCPLDQAMTNNKDVNKMKRRGSAAPKNKGPLDRPAQSKALNENRTKRRGVPPHSDDFEKMKERSWAAAHNKDYPDRPTHPYDCDRMKRHSLKDAYIGDPLDQLEHANDINGIRSRKPVTADGSIPLLQSIRSEKSGRMHQEMSESGERNGKTSNASNNNVPSFRRFHTKSVGTEVTEQNDQDIATTLKKPRRFSRSKDFKPIGSIYHDGGNNNQNASSRINAHGLANPTEHRPTRMGMTKQISESKIAGGKFDNEKGELSDNMELSVREFRQTMIDIGSNNMIHQDVPLDKFMSEKSIHSKWSSMDTLAPSSRANSIRYSRHVPCDEVSSKNSSFRSKCTSVDTPVDLLVEDQIVTKDKHENGDCQSIAHESKWSLMDTLSTELSESRATNDNNGNGRSQNIPCNGYLSEGSLHSKWGSMDSMAPAVLTTMCKSHEVNMNMQSDRFLPGSHGTSTFWTDSQVNTSRTQPQNEISSTKVAQKASNKNILHEFDPIYNRSLNKNEPANHIDAKSCDIPKSKASTKSNARPSLSQIISRTDPTQKNYEELRSYLQQIKVGRSRSVNLTKRRPSKDIVSKQIPTAHIIPGPFY